MGCNHCSQHGEIQKLKQKLEDLKAKINELNRYSKGFDGDVEVDNKYVDYVDFVELQGLITKE